MTSFVKVLARCIFPIFGVTLLVGILSSVGCTVATNGMTLPSPNWMKQRVQYFPAGPQYQFTQEREYLETHNSTSDNVKY
ncbi:MAG: hypothetical protein ACRC2T_08685 [Thermoguttaceae bacterium]